MTTISGQPARSGSCASATSSCTAATAGAPLSSSTSGASLRSFLECRINKKPPQASLLCPLLRLLIENRDDIWFLILLSQDDKQGPETRGNHGFWSHDVPEHWKHDILEPWSQGVPRTRSPSVSGSWSPSIPGPGLSPEFSGSPWSGFRKFSEIFYDKWPARQPAAGTGPDSRVAGTEPG